MGEHPLKIMKTFSRIFPILIAFALSPVGISAGADDTDRAGDSERGEKNERNHDRKSGKDREGRWGSDRGPSGGSRSESHPFFKLSEEERKRVREALSQVWNDSELQAAREQIKVANDAHRDALKAAMMKVDPDIREVLMKVMEPHVRGGDPNGGDPRRRGAGGGMERMRPDFSKEDWQILGEAREKAMQSEAMQAFKSKGEENDRDWKEAISHSKEFRDTLRTEMIRIDPRTEMLMDRIPKGLPQQRPQGRREGNDDRLRGGGAGGGDERPRRGRPDADEKEAIPGS